MTMGVGKAAGSMLEQGLEPRLGLPGHLLQSGRVRGAASFWGVQVSACTWTGKLNL